MSDSLFESRDIFKLFLGSFLYFVQVDQRPWFTVTAYLFHLTRPQNF